MKWETTANAGTSRRVSGVVSAARGCQGRKSVACLSEGLFLARTVDRRTKSVPPQRTVWARRTVRREGPAGQVIGRLQCLS